jgi:large subunit ribosomal protein L9
VTDVKVILRADVSGLGKRGDIVEVSKGYARNFLEPRSLAFPASEGATEQAQAMRRARDLKDAKDREGAEEIAKVLVARTIEVAARAGQGGRLFGSVTSSEVAEAVAAQTGIELDRRDLQMEEHIKELGTHHVTAKLHSDVQFPITIEVVAS